MFALLAGLQLAGVLGALFAVPVAGMLWVLVGAGYRNMVAGAPKPRRNVLARFRRRPPPA
jgi:predicted PurR-regulated permease PerM